jgi:serine/threonine protein kinase
VWRPVAEVYKPKEKIGKGSFGEVIKARHRATGKVVAIKHIELESNIL